MSNLLEIGNNAIRVKYELQKLSTDKKNEVLICTANSLIAHSDRIIKSNEMDVKNGEDKGMHPGLVDRLRLTKERIKDMADGLIQISKLPDPIDETIESFDRPNGLHIEKVRVPMGVVGIIYESRPNVTADAFGLCFKTGNAVILKGGSDAIHSNIAIANCVQDTLEENGISREAIQLIEDTSREIVNEFMKMNDFVDVLIPRGGAALIKNVVNNSNIPVIETGTGNCHIYVDEFAELTNAIKIIINSKTQRIGVCNACESLVIHENIRKTFLVELGKALKENRVEVRGDSKTKEILSDCMDATEEDYGKEYLDYIISIKTVSNVEEAIAHINKYNTKHSEAIITENKDVANKFLQEVDAACVYVNASTRFTDGFEFGFGAEIGISTQKLHARGPMGLKELTTYKYTIRGNGQIRP